MKRKTKQVIKTYEYLRTLQIEISEYTLSLSNLQKTWYSITKKQ